MGSMFPDTNCVVRVGKGRGFVIEHRVAPPPPPRGMRLRQVKWISRRLIVTAGHCLPKLPVAYACSYGDRTYADLVGKLTSKPDTAAECLFVDPIADIAVLGAVDDQQAPDLAEEFDNLTDEATAVRVREARNGRGYLLSLGDKPTWLSTSLKVHRGMWGRSLTTGLGEAGMSGSPILNGHGHAIGVCVIGSNSDTENGPQPILTHSLPAWLLNGIR